jgi:hypothetical protein
MTVHVGELTTEVAVENGQTPQPTSPATKAPGWVERDKARRMHEAIQRDAARTHPGGFDG